METKKKIGIAFLLNLLFSLAEMVGGILTGSIAILSDAIHDFGDTVSIALSYILERLSEKKPDKTYTYGYARFSVLGGLITNLILLVGATLVVWNAVARIIAPVAVDSAGMIVLAVIGLLVNAAAVYFTHGGRSINQKAVNLHMLEDLLGWIIVLLGAIAMRFTGLYWIDPMLSILLSTYIGIHALKGLKSVLDIFLMRTPDCLRVQEVKDRLQGIDGVVDVHHIHLWTMDGETHCASVHIVAKGNVLAVKEAVRAEMRNYGVSHLTVELELPLERCTERVCSLGVEGAVKHKHCHHCH